jgi:hypothetical protein
MGTLKDEFADAFSVFIALQKEGRITKDNEEIYGTFKRTEVQEMIRDVIEPNALVKIFEYEDSGIIYMVPTLENRVLSYTNEELRKEMGLKNNEHLYLAYFCMLVLLSKFFNSMDQTVSTRQYVRIEEILETVGKSMDYFKSLDEDDLTSIAEDLELDLKGIMNSWDSVPEFNETVKNLKKSKYDKHHFGFLNKVLVFLEKEELAVIMEGKEVRITEKLNHVVIKYYFNTGRKERIMRFITNAQKGRG